MSTLQNVEQWMMDALDGHISACDHAALDAYLAEHPDERVVFERMQRMDHTLRAEPPVQAPPTLKLNVMAVLPRTSAAQPSNGSIPRFWLTPPQAVFIGMVAVMLVFIIGVGTLAAISTVPPTLVATQQVPPATAALVTSVGDVAKTVSHASVALARAIFSQPITWLLIGISVMIAFLWARLVVLLLLPTLRFVLA
jgi:anti-sigma factor RsiW